MAGVCARQEFSFAAAASARASIDNARLGRCCNYSFAVILARSCDVWSAHAAASRLRKLASGFAGARRVSDAHTALARAAERCVACKTLGSDVIYRDINRSLSVP